MKIVCADTEIHIPKVVDEFHAWKEINPPNRILTTLSGYVSRFLRTCEWFMKATALMQTKVKKYILRHLETDPRIRTAPRVRTRRPTKAVVALVPIEA